jgi:hypothetical protein
MLSVDGGSRDGDLPCLSLHAVDCRRLAGACAGLAVHRSRISDWGHLENMHAMQDMATGAPT